MYYLQIVKAFTNSHKNQMTLWLTYFFLPKICISH